MNSIPMSHVVDVNKYYGKHFFDHDTMRMFKTRLPKTATQVSNNLVYFITSDCGFDRVSRFYNVRVCDMTTGSIDTLGESFTYTTKAQALKVMRDLMANLYVNT